MKDRDALRLAKITGYIDGRVVRYLRCRWSDGLSELAQNAMAEAWAWSANARVLYLNAFHSTANGRIKADLP